MIETPDKDPEESIVVEFVFYGELTAIDSAAVSIAVVNGTDEGAAAMLDGALQISGTSVLQRVKAGVSNTNYKLRCLAQQGDDKRVRAGILPVREA